jgi:mono/diheme cytochrome c family protein
MNLKFLGAILGSLLFSVSVFSESQALKAEPSVPMDQETIEKGKRLYVANCLRCHNSDPNERGSIGPEVVDSPLSVMTSKIMTGKYPDPLPPGFIPKRKSRAMMPIPRLQNDIPAIWAYVQSVKIKK